MQALQKRTSGMGHEGALFSGPASAGRDDASSLTAFVPYVFAGMALAAAIAFAGAYIGENAVASTAPGTATLAWPQPAPSATGTGTAASSSSGFMLASFAPVDSEEVEVTGVTVSGLKGSLLTAADLVIEPDEQTVAEGGKSDMFGMAEIDSGEDGQQTAAATPPVWKLEQTFAAGGAEKRRRVAERRFQLSEQTCLARAVYFEARSETDLGQLAVARVILNRVKDPSYPKTICGVVYQGADRPNQCQFSFACDGESDEPGNRSQWKQAQAVATRAMAGGDTETASIMGAATHYHADYVRPKWSYSLRRLIKIGRHIFYADS